MLSVTLTFEPMTVKTRSTRLATVVSICVSSGSNLFSGSRVLGISSSQDFHGRRCLTLTCDPMTLKVSLLSCGPGRE